MRPLCCICHSRPCAINYYKNKRVYYRTKCEICAKHDGTAKGVPKWYQSGYRQKDQCERCGFTSKDSAVFNVYHIDGDLNNTRRANLKTVCANCQRIFQKLGVKWRQGDLTPDF
jgi:hypothetical protein